MIPEVPDAAYGRVNKNGATVAPETGAVGITGTSSGGAGLICYDLAFTPVSGTATVARSAGNATTVELVVSPPGGCTAPYTDAATVTRLASNGDCGRPRRLRRLHRRLTFPRGERAAPGRRRSPVSRAHRARRRPTE